MIKEVKNEFIDGIELSLLTDGEKHMWSVWKPNPKGTIFMDFGEKILMVCKGKHIIIDNSHKTKDITSNDVASIYKCYDTPEYRLLIIDTGTPIESRTFSGITI